jgi:hypothetical protein
VTSNSTTKYAYVMSNGALGVGVSHPTVFFQKVTMWTRMTMTTLENADRDA